MRHSRWTPRVAGRASAVNGDVVDLADVGMDRRGLRCRQDRRRVLRCRRDAAARRNHTRRGRDSLLDMGVPARHHLAVAEHRAAVCVGIEVPGDDHADG